MTTDRDRVEAAIDAFYAVNRDDWRDSPVADATFDMMSRALAAADALAPPPVPEHVRDALHAADNLSTKPDNKAWEAQVRFAQRLCERYVRQLLATPAPPADTDREPGLGWGLTGDALATMREIDENRAMAPHRLRDQIVGPAPPADTGDGGAAREARLEGTLAKHRDLDEALTERVRELEEALRPFAIRMPPGRNGADFYRPLEPFSRVGDHRRASALIGGSHE